MPGIEPRRADPTPGGTGPLLGVILVVASAVYALPAADVLARLASGGDGRWPANPLLTAWGVIVGQPSLGYADLGVLGTSTAAAIGPVDATLVRVFAVLLEAVVIAGAVVVTRRFGHLVGAQSGHTGFASVAQAREVLGHGTLMRRCREIRPDLHTRRVPSLALWGRR